MASPTKKVGIELIIIKCQSGVAKHVEVVSTTCYRGGQRQDPPQSVRPAVWPPHQEGRYPLSGQVPSLPLPYPSSTPPLPRGGLCGAKRVITKRRCVWKQSLAKSQGDSLGAFSWFSYSFMSFTTRLHRFSANSRQIIWKQLECCSSNEIQRNKSSWQERHSHPPTDQLRIRMINSIVLRTTDPWKPVNWCTGNIAAVTAQAESRRKMETLPVQSWWYIIV